MQPINGGFQSAALGAFATILAGVCLAADAPTRSIDAGGLTFQVPADWKSSPPTSTMRRAELKIEPIEGDKESAELVVYAFPGGAGTVEANLQRWQNQFKDSSGAPPRIESKTVKGKNVDVTRVETAGHYFPTAMPGRPKEPDRPNSRLFVAIVQTNEVAYYLKMVGPDKTMQATRGDFDKMITSINAARP